jgi:hypothetical protein
MQLFRRFSRTSRAFACAVVVFSVMMSASATGAETLTDSVSSVSPVSPTIDLSQVRTNLIGNGSFESPVVPLTTSTSALTANGSITYSTGSTLGSCSSPRFTGGYRTNCWTVAAGATTVKAEQTTYIDLSGSISTTRRQSASLGAADTTTLVQAFVLTPGRTYRLAIREWDSWPSCSSPCLSSSHVGGYPPLIVSVIQRNGAGTQVNNRLAVYEMADGTATTRTMLFTAGPDAASAKLKLSSWRVVGSNSTGPWIDDVEVRAVD